MSNAFEAASRGKHFVPQVDGGGNKISQANSPPVGVHGVAGSHSTDMASAGSAPPFAVPTLATTNQGNAGSNIASHLARHVAASEAIRAKADARSLVTLETSPDHVTNAKAHLDRLEANKAQHEARVAALEVVLLGHGLSGMVAGDMIGQPHRVHISSLDPAVYAFLRSRGLC